LILNLLKRRIQAQFHCVFDNRFTTVDTNPDKIPDFDSDQWTYLFGESQYQYPFDPDDGDPPRLDNEYTEEFYESVMWKRDERPTTMQFGSLLLATDDSIQPTVQAPPPNSPSPLSPSQRENEPPEGETNVEASTPARVGVTWAPNVAPPAPDPPMPAQPQLRRSTRSNIGHFSKTWFHDEFHLFYNEPDPTPLGQYFICGIYVALVSDPDTLSYQEAMRAPDHDEFKLSSKKEIDGRNLLHLKPLEYTLRFEYSAQYFNSMALGGEFSLRRPLNERWQNRLIIPVIATTNRKGN
jgi:hypothetical protein